jgi:hypothetical protein
MTRALLLAALLVASCKKAPPKGDLPPATDWQAGSQAPAGTPPAGTPPAVAPTNPHAGMAGGSPHGAMPEQTAPRTLEKQADGRLAMGPFTLAAPADWTAKPITSSMRVADFVLPAKGGAEAELVITHFGPNGAGSVEDNVDRWVNQFQQPDGKASRDVAKIEKTKFGGQDATFVQVTGRYVTMGMPGGSDPVDKTDQALLAAIVTSPSGPYYFKLVGAKATVDAAAKTFRGMLESLKLKGS